MLVQNDTMTEKRKEAVYLALGANLGDRFETFYRALREIELKVGPIRRVSSFYETKPLNPPELELKGQPDYLNAVALCETDLEPREVLNLILEIERSLGRDRSRSVRWGPREIDIDILLFGDRVILEPDLKIPHPEMNNRDFVLVPLSEIRETALGNPLQGK